MHIRLLAIALFFLPCVNAQAAPLDDYYAARDAYLKKFEKADVEATARQEEAARKDLGVKMHAILGPQKIDGVLPKGEFTLESLYAGEPGAGKLDGLIFPLEDSQASVTVSTFPILQRWLKEHESWWEPAFPKMPQQIAAAVRQEDFYTQAIGSDAAFFHFGEVPVTKPENADFAYAAMLATGQDLGAEKPELIVVTLIRGGKVYIATLPAKEITKNTVCEKIWQDAQKESAALQEKYAASNLKDQKSFDDGQKALDEGYARFRACFAEQAKQQNYFPALVNQVQDRIARLP